MLKSAILSVSLAAFAFAGPVLAQTDTAVVAPAPDPVRLKLAEQTVARLVPPGTYQKIMSDMMDNMAGGLVEQMIGMDAAMVAGMADESGAEAVEGKTMGDLAAEKDPAFKERLDITMKVTFAELGDLMSEMEPVVRSALSTIYARKYSAKELSDMNVFFATPSGSAFASNFMATFTDKEMMQASFGMMPKMMEAMPVIMKKIETATAHLPPLPEPAVETAADAADSFAEKPFANENGSEPWYLEENWSPAERKKVKALGGKYNALFAKSEAAYSMFDEAQRAVIDDARKRYLADGWKPAPAEEPMTTEASAEAPPPPAASI